MAEAPVDQNRGPDANRKGKKKRHRQQRKRPLCEDAQQGAQPRKDTKADMVIEGKEGAKVRNAESLPKPRPAKDSAVPNDPRTLTKLRPSPSLMALKDAFRKTAPKPKMDMGSRKISVSFSMASGPPKAARSHQRSRGGGAFHRVRRPRQERRPVAHFRSRVGLQQHRRALPPEKLHRQHAQRPLAGVLRHGSRRARVRACRTGGDPDRDPRANALEEAGRFFARHDCRQSSSPESCCRRRRPRSEHVSCSVTGHASSHQFLQSRTHGACTLVEQRKLRHADHWKLHAIVSWDISDSCLE
ncbi:uncharacterized protein [Dermacentor albipictus]|uniref:uncharacterized protein n=1 Tax=Dermacentor albipictus TaxID=60249 RepID=UPI0038FCA74D